MTALFSAGFTLRSLYLYNRSQNASEKSPAVGAEIAFLMADVLHPEKVKYHPAKQARQAFYEIEQRGFP